jgi:hypothetical protein
MRLEKDEFCRRNGRKWFAAFPDRYCPVRLHGIEDYRMRLKSQSKSKNAEARQGREAKALRENLRKRKVQAELRETPKEAEG